jgi:hypothetical protein
MMNALSKTSAQARKLVNLALTKLKTKRVGIVLASIVFILSLSIPIVFYYLPRREVQAMGDFEVFGFDTDGLTSVENAVGKRFGFIGGHYNISIPVEDCQIDSLKVIKSKQKGSAFYDTIVFNGTGRLDIQANNILHFFYDTLKESSMAVMDFTSKKVQSFLPQSRYPSTEIWFWFQPNSSESFSISLLEGNSRELSLDFGAFNGSLNIIGSQNYTLPLKNDRAGILLTVSIPRNRAYTALIQGKASQVLIDNWEIVSYVLQRGTDNVNSLKVRSPKGELAYDGKSRELLGSQDLNFIEFFGVAHVFPTSNPTLFRVLINGDVNSIILESAGRRTNLTEKYWDILFSSPFPFPWIGFAVSVGIFILYFKPSRKDALVLFSIVIPVVGLLGWAIYTEQSQWIQNVLAYALLLVTVIGYLIHKPREEKQTYEK